MSDTTPTHDLSFQLQGSLNLAGAEISAFDPASARLFVTSNSGLQVIDLSNPASPSLITTIDLTTLGFDTTDVTSVATKGGIVAVALPNANKALPGEVVFLDAATGALLNSVTVGALPDMLTFTPDGTKVLVANEGEVVSDADFGGEGSVSIIDLSGGVASATVQTAGFTAFDGQEAALRAAGVRIWAGKSVSEDVEPEYIAVSADGTKAMVTLQEANAVGILDIATATFTDIVPLGTKDFSELFADFSDRDGPGNATLMNLETGNPVSGLYMPDAIDSYTSGGQDFYVIANEGDDRDDFLSPDETIRVGSSSYDLDDTAFPNEAALKANSELGRLTVSNAPGLRGDTDGDGDIDEILVYGGRSFSILDADGAIVFDSGDMIERIVAEQFPALFDDTRSDNKGPEPEGVEVAVIGDRTYAMVGLERSHLTLTFDITDPTAVTYTGAAQRPGDLNPEGQLFISAEDSPTGQALLVTSNEASNTVSVFGIATSFTLQLLHFSDAEAGLLAPSTAPNLAALVDAFDGQYANTLILSGGDNFIPSPFLAAGTDPSVGATHDKGTNFAAADIEILNRIGVEASTVGNHEFDLGTNAFSDAINDAAFPYLSANLIYSGDSALASRYQETVGVGGLENATTLARKLVPSAVVEKGGEIIGLVGVTTQILESISSTGGVEVAGFAGDGLEVNDMTLLAAQLQPVIDDLIAQGVNKIILMSHLQQLAFEVALAPLLSGVDIILAAGSNTRLGDDNDQAATFPGHAANFAGDYPLVATGADGGTTLIVNTDNEFTYLGRLVVEFDATGAIKLDSLDASINGAYAATTANVAAAWGVTEAELADTAFAEGTKGEQVADITEAVQAVIAAKDGEVWGFSKVYLEGERSQVRVQETNLGNLSADANLDAAREALADGTFIASLKNGGGIRAQIGSVDVVTGEKEPTEANAAVGKRAGGISTLDIENALRFDNKLMVFDTTAAGLKAILEHAAGLSPGSGGYMQLGGLRVSYDPDNAAGSRVLNVSIINERGTVIGRVIEDGQVAADAPATISVVTLNFTANGGDGYPIKANAENFRYLLTDGTLSAPVDEALDFTAAATLPANALGEQQAFKEYLQENHFNANRAYNVADTAQSEDMRIQNLNVRTEDAVYTGVERAGTAGVDRMNGSAGDDVLAGAAGTDTLRGLLGDDTLEGGSEADLLLGAEGDDVLDGGEGADRLMGGTGNDLAMGGGGNDSAYGGAGADTLDGGADDDLLSGEAGDDLLLGGFGLDRLFGGAGADTLDGGAGNDLLRGDAGADVFRFASLSDGADRILDFVAGIDLIDLSAIDADGIAAGDQAFGFGGADFLGGGVASVRVRQIGNQTQVQIDDGSGGAAEMVVRLIGLHALQESDFIL